MEALVDGGIDCQEAERWDPRVWHRGRCATYWDLERSKIDRTV